MGIVPKRNKQFADMTNIKIIFDKIYQRPSNIKILITHAL